MGYQKRLKSYFGEGNMKNSKCLKCEFSNTCMLATMGDYDKARCRLNSKRSVEPTRLKHYLDNLKFDYMRQYKENQGKLL